MGPTAPVHIPAHLDPQLWQFLARFALHSMQKAWNNALAALTPANTMALESFDELTANGVDSWTRKGPYIIGFEDEKEKSGRCSGTESTGVLSA